MPYKNRRKQEQPSQPPSTDQQYAVLSALRALCGRQHRYVHDPELTGYLTTQRINVNMTPALHILFDKGLVEFSLNDPEAPTRVTRGGVNALKEYEKFMSSGGNGNGTCPHEKH